MIAVCVADAQEARRALRAGTVRDSVVYLEEASLPAPPSGVLGFNMVLGTVDNPTVSDEELDILSTARKALAVFSALVNIQRTTR